MLTRCGINSAALWCPSSAPQPRRKCWSASSGCAMAKPMWQSCSIKSTRLAAFGCVKCRDKNGTHAASRPFLIIFVVAVATTQLAQPTRPAPQVPTASFTHFLVKLVLAAPASFFSAAWVAQEVVASFSHFVMKLLSAAPASFLSAAWLLHVASCAKAVAAKVESSAASKTFFIGSSSIVCRHESLPQPSIVARRLYVSRRENPVIAACSPYKGGQRREAPCPPDTAMVGARSLSSGRPKAGPVGFAHPTDQRTAPV